MNYEQLWKGLKADYERYESENKTKVKNLDGKKDKLSETDKLLLDYANDNSKIYTRLLKRMESLENMQTLSERETIERAIDELRRDRKYERYRIKALRFERGNEEEKWNYYHYDKDIYDDYHLYSEGCLWFIVFYKGDKVIWYQEFERVKILYWDNEKESK